jgi:hypothetical protein
MSQRGKFFEHFRSGAIVRSVLYGKTGKGFLQLPLQQSRFDETSEPRIAIFSIRMQLCQTSEHGRVDASQLAVCR